MDFDVSHLNIDFIQVVYSCDWTYFRFFVDSSVSAIHNRPTARIGLFAYASSIRRRGSMCRCNPKYKPFISQTTECLQFETYGAFGNRSYSLFDVCGIWLPGILAFRRTGHLATGRTRYTTYGAFGYREYSLFDVYAAFGYRAYSLFDVWIVCLPVILEDLSETIIMFQLIIACRKICRNTGRPYIRFAEAIHTGLLYCPPLPIHRICATFEACIHSTRRPTI
jgi:hypothetical protein